MYAEIDLEALDPEEFLEECVSAIYASDLWDQRSVSQEKASLLLDKIQRALFRSFAQLDPSSLSFEKTAITLALLGSSMEEREALQKDFGKPHFFLHRFVELICLGKSSPPKWNKYKEKILWGLVIVAAAAVAILVAINKGSSSKKPEKKKALPDPPESTTEFLHPHISFEEKNVRIQNQLHSYEDILQPEYRKDLLKAFHKTTDLEYIDFSLRQKMQDLVLGKTYLGIGFPAPLKERSPCEVAGINGMNTTRAQAQNHQEYFNQFLPEKNMDWVYNKTHGPFLDGVEIFTLNYQGISPNTAAALKKNWEAFDQKHQDNSQIKYLQFCHSQGAIHVKNALEQSRPEIRNRIIVVAIAPAAIITDNICYDASNYVNKKDFVHYGEILGSLIQDRGLPIKTLQVLKNRKELIFLDPHPESKGFGHDLQDPTYEERIERHITEYFQQKGKYP